MMKMRFLEVEITVFLDSEDGGYRANVSLPTGEIFRIDEPTASFLNYQDALTGVMVWLNAYADNYTKNNVHGFMKKKGS